MIYSKTCVKQPLSKRPKMVFKTSYRLMQVNSIGEYSALLLIFIKLLLVIKISVLSIFEWPFYAGFTVYAKYHNVNGTNCPPYFNLYMPQHIR